MKQVIFAVGVALMFALIWHNVGPQLIAESSHTLHQLRHFIGENWPMFVFIFLGGATLVSYQIQKES